MTFTDEFQEIAEVKVMPIYQLLSLQSDLIYSYKIVSGLAKL